MTRVLPPRRPAWNYPPPPGHVTTTAAPAAPPAGRLSIDLQASVFAHFPDIAHFPAIVKAIAPDWRTVVKVGGTNLRLRGDSEQRRRDGLRIVTIYRSTIWDGEVVPYGLYRQEGTLLHEMGHLLADWWTSEVEADAIGAALAIEYAELLHSPLEDVLDGLSERAQLDRDKLT